MKTLDFSNLPKQIGRSAQIDSYIWGSEIILWGYDLSHQYTLKILKPKAGGCLSLQYHDKKSETWLVHKGLAWAMVVVGDKVCTRIMRAGDAQNLKTGTIHRLAGISDDLEVFEASTPDAHAADKSQIKDVVRLHCTYGREVSPAKNPAQAKLIQTCSELTLQALADIQQGKIPTEYNVELLLDYGALVVD